MQVLRATAGALSSHPALFANLFLRELRSRYLGSITGMFWAVLHPLMLLGVYSFLFTTIFRVRLPELGSASFLAFVAAGLWPWMAAQDGMQRATVSIINQSALIKKVAFPHELVIVASVAAASVVHLAGYVVILAFLWASGEPIQPAGFATALLVWAIVFVGTCGAGFVLAALQVFLKDTEHVLAPLLMVLFYLTPILYPPSLVPESLRAYVEANPFSYLVGRAQDGLFARGPLFAPGDLLALALAIALFLAGRWVFRRLSPHFEDFV